MTDAYIAYVYYVDGNGESVDLQPGVVYNITYQTVKANDDGVIFTTATVSPRDTSN